MALKYYAYFNSTAWAGVDSVEYKLEILDSAFSGTPTEVVMGGSPFSEEEVNQDDLPYGIKNSRFKIEIVSEVLSVDDFYTEDGYAIKFAFYEVGTPNTLIRSGYLLSEDTEEEYADGIKTIKITATDGLELLKNINYELALDVPYTGLISIFTHLRLALLKLDTNLNFVTSFPYQESSVTVTTEYDSLVFSDLHSEIFNSDTAWDVLFKITNTLKSKLYQEDGKWYFIHDLLPDGRVQYAREWTHDGTLVNSFEFERTVDVGLNLVKFTSNGSKKKERSYKKVETFLEMKGRTNYLRNPDFQDGFNEWVSYGITTYDTGGVGSKTNPFYIQIDGYQSATDNDYLVINRMAQYFLPLYEKGTNTDIEEELNKSIRIQASALGNGVRNGVVSVTLDIETNLANLSFLQFSLNEGGEWTYIGQMSDLYTPSNSWLDNAIKIKLTDADRQQKTDWTKIDVESGRILDIVARETNIWKTVLNGFKIEKATFENFTKVYLTVTLTEGYSRTSPNITPEWVRYSGLNLQILDKSRAVGLKKDKYQSIQSTNNPKNISTEAFFGDYYDKEQHVAIQKGGISTLLWKDENGENQNPLLMGLNVSLLSFYSKPLSIFTGEIYGRLKKYNRINLDGFSRELIPLTWSYDFNDGVVNDAKYAMLPANYIVSNNKKIGIYGDGEEIPYEGDYPDGVWKYDEVPVDKSLLSKLFQISRDVVFDDGYLTFSKIDNESGINWYDSITGDKTDYFLTTADGFVMKSEISPYEVTLDFTELTANTKLIIPPLSADAYLLTSENGWVLEGNNISTAKKLGSTTAQDWTIINNDTTVATVKEGFLDLGDNKLGLGKVNFLPTTAQDVTDAGDLAWDADRKTLSLRFNGDHGHVMQDQFYYVKNQTGSTITKGSFVGFAGSLGASGILLISKFIANNTTDSQNFMGVAHEDIPDGGDGRVMHFGEVRGIDLTGIADGTKLYASTTTAGAWQTTVPVAPNNIILVAAVKNGGSNGSIHVRPTIGSKLANDESVLFGTLANNNLLAYESATSLWKNKTYSELGLFPTPSGLTTNYVTKWNGTALANSQIFDSGTLIGLGTAIPATLLDVRGQISANIGSASSPTFSFVGDLNTGMYSSTADTINFATGGVNRASITSVGDVIIGSAAGTNSLIVSKSITGGTAASGIRSSGQIQSDVTSEAFLFRAVANQANFALTSFVAYESNLATILGTGTTFVNFRSQTSPASYTNVYGFQSTIASGTNRYGAYFNGTAQNHFRGNVGIGIGSTTPTHPLHVIDTGAFQLKLERTSVGSYLFGISAQTANSTGDLLFDGIQASQGYAFRTRDASNAIINALGIDRNGNVGVGNFAPSYKLDVSGTAHFTGAVTFDTVPSSLQDATSANHLVRYSQWISGTTVKYLPTAVKTVSLTNITLSGTQTVNGVALVATDRILVTGQTTGAENGVWVVAAGSWTRATDSDTDTELRGFIINVSGGTYAGYKYINTNQSTITVGTTAITYSEFSNVSEIDPIFTSWRDTTRTANTFWAAPNGSNGAGTWRTIVAADIPTLNQNTTGSAATLTTARSIGMTGDVDWSVSFNGSGNVTAAGTLASVNSDIGTFNNVTVNAKGLVTSASNVSYLTGNQTITISGDASGIGSTSIALTLATVATAGTYRSVTINAKGLVTSGTNPTTLSGYGITDAQPLDGDLTAIAGLTGINGLLRKTDTNTWILDTNSYFQTPTGLTTNYVTKWNGSALANSTIFDNGSIGIGTVNPTYKLDIVDATGIILRHSATANTSGAVRFIGGSYTGNGMTGIVFGANLNNNQLSYGGGTSLAEPATQHIFFTGTYGTKASGTEVFRIANNGNVGINSSNPSYKLDVVGTGRFTDNVIIGSSGAGVNSLIINKVLTTLGNGTDASTLRLSGTIQSDVTGNAFQLRSLVSTQATPFNITNLFHISTAVSSIGAGSTITNQYGLFIDASLTQATNNYGLWSAISSGTNRWNLYMAGTAQNYIAGNLGIGSGTTTPSEALHLTGNIRYSGTLKPSNTAGTNGQFLKTNGTADSWATLTTSDISNLSSYTGLDVRYFTETESDARFVSLVGSYGNPSWITSLAWSKLTGVPSTFEPSAHTLDSHSNVTITSNSSGEILKWDGSKWINNTLSEAGIQATLGGTGIVKSTGGVISYLTDNTSNWNTAYGWGNHASAGYLTTSLATTTYQPLDGDLTAIAGLSGTSGFLKKTAANTWTLDTSTYLTGNQTITISGDATGSGATSIAITLANSGVTNGTYRSVTVNAKGLVTGATNPTTISGYGITDFYSQVVNGFVTGANSSVLNTDTLEVALEKLQGQINARISGNQTITLSGIVTGSGTTAITTAIADSALSIAKTSGLQTALDGKFANPSGLTTNYVSKWNGTAFVNSQIFDNGTNIGIGTITPNAKFDVAGVLRISGPGTNRINIQSASAGTVDRLDFISQTTNLGIGLQLNPNGTSVVSKIALANQSNTGTNFGSIFIEANGANGYISPQSVGTPTTALSSLSLGGGSGLTNWANVVIPSANVGINTTSPSSTSKLHVDNAVGSSVRFRNTYFSNTLESNTSFARGGIFNNAEYIDEGGATKVWKIRNYGANDAAGILFSNSGTLNFISVPSTGTVDKSLTHSELLSNARMTILSSGFVGINTTSPAYTLDVVGTIRTTNLLITSGAAVGSFLKANNVNGTSVWSSITTSDISNLSSWAGSTSITTLGTIASGTWNATTIAIAKGGTGLTALGTAGQLLKVNSGATALEYFTPTYISGNQTITLSGVVTGSGTTAITTSIADGALSIAKTSGLQSALDGKQATLGGTGFVKSTGGVISYDTSTYLTANQTITLSGDVSGSGTTSITATLATITQASTGNFRKITLDTKGRVTGNTAVVIGDLTALGATTLTSFSSSATGLTYTNTTGVFSLTSGYSIPTTANQTNWNTAYGWGNHASAGYLTTSTAASTYQPLLPSGTAGQFLIRNASNQLEFSTLELEPVSLSNNKIAVGDSANYLSEYNNFEFLESRFISIYRPSDSSRALYIGMDSLSNNSFITAAGGHLTLKGDTGIYLHGFTGFGNKMVIVDGDGKLGYTDIPSGGSGGSSSITSTYIGYGSTVNTLTGNSTFTYLDNRYIHLTSSGSDFNLGTFSSAGFIESVNGNLLLQARSTFGVVVDEGYFQVDTLGGGGTKMVVVDNNGKFGTQTIPSGGGVPALTAMNIGFGDGSNLMTSSSNFQYDATKTAMYFNSGGDYLYVGKSVSLSDMYEITAVGTRGIQLNTAQDIVIKNDNHLYLGAGANNKRVHIGRGASYNDANHYLVINGETFSFSMDNIPGWGDSNSASTPQVGDKVLFNVVDVGGNKRFVPQKINKKLFSSLTSGDTVLIL